MAHVMKGDPTPRTTEAYNRMLARVPRWPKMRWMISDPYLTAASVQWAYAEGYYSDGSPMDCEINDGDSYYERLPE